MRITKDNISFSLSVLQECFQDMGNCSVDKKVFLDSLVLVRVHECNKKYMEEFRKDFNNIVRNIRNLGSIDALLKATRLMNRKAKVLQKLQKSIYNYL